MFQTLGVFAEFERSIIQERVRAGLQRAKREGRATHAGGSTPHPGDFWIWKMSFRSCSQNLAESRFSVRERLHSAAVAPPSPTDCVRHWAEKPGAPRWVININHHAALPKLSRKCDHKLPACEGSGSFNLGSVNDASAA